MVRQRSPGSLTQTLKHTDVACIDDRGDHKGPFSTTTPDKSSKQLLEILSFPLQRFITNPFHAKSSPTTSQRSSIECFST
jgi:hypothetical protein